MHAVLQVVRARERHGADAVDGRHNCTIVENKITFLQASTRRRCNATHCLAPCCEPVLTLIDWDPILAFLCVASCHKKSRVLCAITHVWHNATHAPLRRVALVLTLARRNAMKRKDRFGSYQKSYFIIVFILEIFLNASGLQTCKNQLSILTWRYLRLKPPRSCFIVKGINTRFLQIVLLSFFV